VSDVSAAWAVVAAALGAATLSTGGAFLLDAFRSKRANRDDRKSELRVAGVELISGAQKLSHRAGTLYEIVIASRD